MCVFAFKGIHTVHELKSLITSKRLRDLNNALEKYVDYRQGNF